MNNFTIDDYTVLAILWIGISSGWISALVIRAWVNREIIKGWFK